MKQSQASIKRSIKNLRMIIDSETVDPITKRMAYFAECTLRWSIEDTVSWQRPEVDLEDEVDLLLKEVAQHGVERTASQIRIPIPDVNSANYRFVKA